MSSTVHQLPFKMRAKSAAADPNCTAVALAELPAAFVSFQLLLPSLPPTQNAHSADASRVPACHFGGSIAICAVNAVTTATFTTKGSPLGQHFEVLELDNKKPFQVSIHLKRLRNERATRFELVTSSLARKHSTAELRPHLKIIITRHDHFARVNFTAVRWLHWAVRRPHLDVAANLPD